MIHKEAPHYLIDSRSTMGGIARYTFELGRLMSECHSETCISYFGADKSRTFQPSKKRVGIRSILSDAFGGGKRILTDQFALPFKAHLKGVNLLHSTNYLVPLLIQIPVVVNCYDISLVHYFSTKKTGVMKYYERFIFLHSLRKAAHIIVPSKTVASEIKKHFGITEAKVTSIYPPLPSFCFEPHKRVVQLDHRFPQKPFFLSVGTIEPRKNLRRLLEGWKRAYSHSQIPLVIVGPYGWQERQLEKEELAIVDDLYWFSDIDDSTLVLLYQKALAVVQYSLAEGFDYPVAEGLCQGTPVIASDIEVHREILAGCGTLVSPHKPEELAVKLIEVSTWSKEQLAAYRQEASQQADLLKKDTSIDPYFNLYRRVLAGDNDNSPDNC